MTTDISKIRLSLKDCEEVTLPYKFPYKCWIKYISINGEDEAFYEGGEFLRMGDHKIFLLNKGKQLCAPTHVRTDEGEIIYRSRFFIDSMKTPDCVQKKEELEKVVLAQQNVIKNMSKQLKILEDQAHEKQCENYDIRTELEEREHDIKELLVKEKKYKLALSRFIN